MRLPTTGARRILPGMAMALAVSAAIVMPAAAHRAATATGAFTFASDTKTPIGQAGGDNFIHEVASIAYTGGLAGIAHADNIVIVHSDGSVSGYGTETCQSCRLGGRTGSFTALFAFHSTSTGIEGNEVFVGGSGGLAGLHGGGPFQGGPGGNTYSYDYRFAPARSRGSR
jgi:Protein of unknown function (DUF3224)